ncbi:MAG TPA: hypothetical protein O0X42_00640 [Methanocorpusculum sp.]|nr:hypothetical protein [Methanocorpusculum sp.]
MANSEKDVQIYVRLPARLVEKLDRYQTRLGFDSRADMFKGFVLILLDKFAREEDELLFQTASELKQQVNGRESFTEHQLDCILRDIIDSMARPIVAMRKADGACDAVLDDVQDAFHEKTGIWLPEEIVREGFRDYELMNKGALTDYRMGVLHRKEE